MKNWVFLLLVFILPLAAQAGEVSLTLDDAITIALRDNRDILLGKEAIEKAKWQILESWADVLPSLGLGLDRDYTQNLRDKRYRTDAIHAGLKQNIFQSGKIVSTIKYNEYKKGVSEAVLDKTKLELVLDVKKAFCTLVLAQGFANLNKEILENTTAHLSLLEERFKSGESSESDITGARACLSNARQAYDESLNQIEANQVLLRQLLYLNESVAIKPQAAFTYTPEEINYDKAFLEAMRKRPEIRQYEMQEKADKKNIAIARTGMLPSIYASFDSYGADNLLTATGATGKWKNYQVFGITFSWPFFDGFATAAKIEQAQAGLKETQLNRQKAIQDIAAELKNAYLSMKNAVSKIDAVESDARFYKDNLSVVKNRYKEGITSALDVSDANLKYAVSMFNKEQTLYDYIISKGSIEKATGGI